MAGPAVVRLMVRPENGGFAAHSPDVFGLNLWAATMDALHERAREGIRLLYEVDHGGAVNVQIDSATAARASE
jgi:hypothetical protein